MPSSWEDRDDKRPEGPDSFEMDEGPETQSEGSLIPPPAKPPTAIGGAGQSPFDPRRFFEAWRQPGWRAGTFHARVNQFLDAVDSFADRVREGLGLR